jgi:hypothetical protein
MPRMRRSARERRKQPQLNLEIWQLETGKKSYNQLSTSAKWSHLVLPCDRDFWDGVLQKVADGEIEVSPDVVHRVGDVPLLPDWKRGF